MGGRKVNWERINKLRRMRKNGYEKAESSLDACGRPLEKTRKAGVVIKRRPCKTAKAVEIKENVRCPVCLKFGKRPVTPSIPDY